MKDSATDVANKPEYAVDLEAVAVVATKMCLTDQGDTTVLPATLGAAEANLAASNPAPMSEASSERVTDKGDFAREMLKFLYGGAWETRIAEPTSKALSR